MNRSSTSEPKPRRFCWQGLSLRAVSVSLLIVALLLAGAMIVFMTVIEPRRSVAQVAMNDGRLIKITTRELQQRLRFERARQVNQQKRENAARKAHERAKIEERHLYTLGFAAGVLDRRGREILIREAAEQRGLVATDAEIDLLISQSSGDRSVAASPTATVAATSSSTPSVPQQKPATVLGVAREDLPANYREIIRAEILEKKLRQAFFRSIPAQQDRVRLNLIRFEFEADARQALGSQLNGQTFADLYGQVIHGAVGSATGLARDWSSAHELANDYNGTLSEAAFRLAIGEHFSQPVSAANGWYLAQALGREIRPMSEAWRGQRGEDAFNQWLERQQARVTQFPIWMERVPIKWLPPDLPASLFPSNRPDGPSVPFGALGAIGPSQNRTRATALPGAKPGSPLPPQPGSRAALFPSPNP